MNEIEIYKTKEGTTQIEVQFDKDTVWLSQQQMAALFKQTKQNISLHINNCFKEKELEANSVVKESLTTAIDGKNYKVKYYNLDVVISVGYRVKSKEGTQFRQWATQRLKDYLVKGYAINQKRLDQLQQVVNIIQQSGNTENLQVNEAKGLLDILSHYTQSFVLLNKFDSQSLTTEKLNETITYEIKYPEAIAVVHEVKKMLLAKKEACVLFGNEKDESFKGLLGNVVQSFKGHYVYPSIEEQAAHLLYFIIKNHPFTDGNKRIGAFLFVWFLQRNKHRFKKSGEVKINDNGLTALALLVAQSNPDDKDLMIKLIVNLINNQ